VNKHGTSSFTTLNEPASGTWKIYSGAHGLNAAIYAGFSVYYWRDRDQEVDFIIESRGKLLALEVKSNEKVSLKGMQLFRQHFPHTKILLIGKGGIPWQEFLTIPPLELF